MSDATEPAPEHGEGAPDAPDERCSARDSILDAAELLFAQKGYAGTSMRALAAAASTSQALIHHHFGTKSQLYKAVKERIVHSFLQAELLPPLDLDVAADPTDGIHEALCRYWRFLQERPHLLRMSAWSRLEGAPEPLMEKSPFVDVVLQHMRQLQAAGLLRPDLDLKLHMVQIGGVVEHWAAIQHELSSFFGDADPAELTRNYFRQVASVLTWGSLNRPSAPEDR